VNELLTVQPDTKKIFLKDQRIILMEADSLGTLRKELISSLGIDRAKGFLLRYGWQCGYNVATDLMKIFPRDDTMKWFETGPQFHEITGSVLVTMNELIYHPETGYYFAEGYWHHSYEAEQHIKNFDYHHEPVCFTLTGFAGGYVSKHLGRRVIFKEIKCAGKGDPYCHWVAKPEEDWGEEIANELEYYEAKNLALELEKAYHRIEAQKEMFQKVVIISEELSKVLLRREGLLAICKILSKHLKETVIIEDVHFHLLESYGEYQHHDFHSFINHPNEKTKQLTHQLTAQKRMVHFSVPAQYGWQHERLIAPIMIKNEVQGYISIIKEAGSFNEMEILALERAATVCAIHLLNERTAIETEQRIKGEFLDELLSGGADTEKLISRMSRIGYNLQQPHYIFLFNLEYPNEFNRKAGELYRVELKKEIAETIYDRLKQMGQSCLVSSRLDQIIALIPSKLFEQLDLDAAAFGQLLVSTLHNKYNDIHVTAGISSLCTNIKYYKKAYNEAEKAIKIGKFKKGHHPVVSFDELGLIAKILNENNIDEMKLFAAEVLKDLLSYDQKNRFEFLKTLFYFFEHQGNVLKTARSLMLSAGSINYRIKRIEEICNLNLASADDYYNAYLALQLLIFLGEIEI
jgi:sugar diacid utilization regulator